MMIAGIDPGISGAIAFVFTGQGDATASVFDMPVMANGKAKGRNKRQINGAGLREILTPAPDKVYLEKIASMPGQGVSSTFSMGQSFGTILGVCAALSIPIEIVTPQKWKKYFGLTSDKEQCRAKAIELFPGLPLDRKKDHDRAEALLIAQYGRELLEKRGEV